MKLSPKELLKYAKMIDFQGKKYNLQWIETKKETEKLLKQQPVWKILSCTTEFYFSPFFIMKISEFYPNVEKADKFVIYNAREGAFLIKNSIWQKIFNEKDILIFNNVNEALELISPNLLNKPKFRLNHETTT